MLLLLLGAGRMAHKTGPDRLLPAGSLFVSPAQWRNSRAAPSPPLRGPFANANGRVASCPVPLLSGEEEGQQRAGRQANALAEMAIKDPRPLWSS